MSEPLSYRMRPKQLNEVVGHKYLCSNTGILTNMIKKNSYYSFILYGPPGVGKTTIAKCFCSESNKENYWFNASTDDKKKLQNILSSTDYGQIILVVDEIHRMNNNIQEVLLPYVENGKVILIGLTTLSAYQAVNIAIRSRVQIYELKELDNEDIIILLKRALRDVTFSYDEKVLYTISSISNNEARSALNILEAMLIYDDKSLTLDTLKLVSGKHNLALDKNQEHYYELLSAMQKSIRGSDVDAALYYLAKLIILGDLKIILRRLMVIAYEDIGLANPNMGLRVYIACKVCEELGFPEASKMLSNVVIDMAISAKSNTADVAINNAIEFVENNPNLITPDHVINAKIKLNDSIYHYPHNDINSINDQTHLPPEIKVMRFYHGKLETPYEKALVERNELIKKIKKIDK